MKLDAYKPKQKVRDNFSIFKKLKKVCYLRKYFNACFYYFIQT